MNDCASCSFHYLLIAHGNVEVYALFICGGNQIQLIKKTQTSGKRSLVFRVVMDAIPIPGTDGPDVSSLSSFVIGWDLSLSWQLFGFRIIQIPIK